MLLKSDTVHNAWAATQRTVDIKLTIKGTEYDASDITSLTFDSGAMNGEALSLGSTYQNTIKVVFSNLIEGLALTDEITPELGIKLPDGTWDYTSLGVFVIDAEVQQDRNNNTTTVSASDRMCMLGGTYKSKLTYPAAINDIAVEIANLAAVKLNEDDFARLPTDKVASFGKVTYRDAIGFVAQFAGGFATFDRDGLLDIRQLADPSFDVAPSQYQSKGLTKNEALYRIGGIACTVTTTATDDSGNETQDTKTLQSGSTAGTQITISNPGMTQDLLDGLYEHLQDLNFYPFSLSWFGDPNVEAGDWIEVQDTAGNKFKTPNLLYALTFSGGVTATSKADTTVSASANFVYKGQLNQIVNNIRQYLNASGHAVSEGIDEPSNPKAGDIWFKKDGPDTTIMTYVVDPKTGIGSWVEEVSTKGVTGLDEALKKAKAQLDADIAAAKTDLAVAKQDVADLQVKLRANDDAQAQLSKDLSANSTVLAQAQADIVTNAKGLTELDAKLKANDDAQAQLKIDLEANTAVQAQLTTDLAANTKLINANKESVDAALVTVNKTLTQAQTDTAAAVKNADLAVTNANSAVEASGLATQTANAASDAALAAKNLATQVSSDFDGVRSQAATAANDAATALSNSNSAVSQASTAIGNASDALSQAKSALVTASSVKTSMQPAITAAVDTAKGELNASIQTVQNNLNNIQVGGRNRLLDSNNPNSKGWIVHSATGLFKKSVDAIDGISVVKFSASQNLTSWYYLGFNNFIERPHNIGEQWTLTMRVYAYVDLESGSWSVQNGDKSGKAISFAHPALSKGWNTVSGTGTVVGEGSSYSMVYWNVGAPNKGDLLAIAWMTLVRGNCGTGDYIAPPEEVQGQITTNSLDITANSKEIALAAKQATVDTLANQVTDNTSQLKLTATSANLEVTSKKVDTLSQTVTNQGARLDLTATSAQLKVTDNKVDALNKTVGENSAQLKLTATSAALETQSKRVDTISGNVDTNTAAITAANGEIELKANNSRVDTLSNTVKQQGIDLKAAQGQLALKLTQSDLTNGLAGYATQTWASQQITASANGFETQLSSVTTKLDNLKVGGTNLLQNSDFSKGADGFQGWISDRNKSVTVAVDGTAQITTAGGNGRIYKNADVSPFADLADGEQFTISFDAYSSVPGTVMSVGQGLFTDQQVSCVQVSLTTTPTRYVATLIKSGTLTFSIYLIGPGGQIGNIGKIKLERGNKATDWSPAPEDSATYTDAKVADLKLTVDGLSATFAKQTDLEKATSDFKVTSDGLNLVTAVTGIKGEKVTQVIADVKGIKTTMTGPNGFTNRLQTLEGFQDTATDNINGLQAQQTTLAGQWTSTVETLNNLQVGGTNLIVHDGEKPGYLDASGNYTNTPVFDVATMQKKISVTPGEKLVFHQEVVVDKKADLFRWDWFDTDGNYLGRQAYASVKPLVWTVPDGATQLWVSYGTTGNVKLERGTIATDWSPAPEDLATGSQITQLQDNIDMRVKVDGKIAAALNLSADGGGTVTIRGASLYVTAASHFDNASIQSASIASLDATKITSGSISADRLATTKLNADNITSGSISAARIASTAINADNITSGSISADRLTTTELSATNITSGTFDASKMTVKNINAGSITSGSIATALLASTKLNADNITSGSIAAARIATTALSATNITSGTLDVGKLTVKNLSADLIATGTIDASKITVENLSASNIIGGELDALLVNVKNLNADNIITGTLNAGLLNVIGLNASAISAGTITGANLAINLGTGEVMFQKGSIKSADGHLNIDVNNGTFVQSDGTKGMMFAKGNLYLSSSSWWDGLSNPDAAPKPDYGFIGYTDTVLTARGFGVIGRDALTLGLTDNDNPGMEYTSSPVITMDRSNVTLDFAGELATIQAGREFTITTNPFYNSGQTPGIEIGSNVGRSGIGDRVFIDGSYVYIPSAYSRTASGSANLIVSADGALVRTSSATKYKSNIERFRNTDMGETLLTLPQAHWYNKQDMQRYTDDPQHYSMPELDYGMIAEDLAAAGLEDLVVRGDDGQLEDIRYDRIAPALLPLLAKMKQEIEELKSAAKSA